jgi:hypothetical protein
MTCSDCWRALLVLIQADAAWFLIFSAGFLLTPPAFVV